MREQIAALIEPLAWHFKAEGYDGLGTFERGQSLTKADAILSLLNRKTNDE